MANVAITVRRKIIKSIQVSIEESSGEDSSEEGNMNKHSLEKQRHKHLGNDPSKDTSPGATGVARPFISDTSSSSTRFDKQSKNVRHSSSSSEILNPNLFKEKSASLEMYENIRAPSKILDLRSLLINENEDNIIFEMVGNNYEMFEVDQLSG